MLLEVSRFHGFESLGILHWDHVSFSEMEVEIVGLGAEGKVLSSFERFAWLRENIDVAPSSGWEVVIGRVDSNLIGKNTKFKSATDHDIVLLIINCVGILWELIEEWLDESSTFDAVGRHLSVVVSDQVIFVLDGHSHDIHILYAALIEFSPSVWLLGNGVPAVVVSREWIERSNNMPSGAKLSIGVSHETANVRTSELNTHDVVSHDTSDGETHVLLLTEVISEPSGSEFTGTSVGTSLDNHSSLSLIFEPVMSSLDFHGTKERMSFKFSDILGTHIFVIGMN